MKIFLALAVFLCASFAVADNGLYLVGAGYYLDDINQTVSPKLGLASHSDRLGGGWSDDLYFGFGYLQQAVDMSGNQPNGWYDEFKAKLNYDIDPCWRVSGGIGAIGNRAVYGSLDDHAYLQVAYKLR